MRTVEVAPETTKQPADDDSRGQVASRRAGEVVDAVMTKSVIGNYATIPGVAFDIVGQLAQGIAETRVGIPLIDVGHCP